MGDAGIDVFTQETVSKKDSIAIGIRLFAFRRFTLVIEGITVEIVMP